MDRGAHGHFLAEPLDGTVLDVRIAIAERRAAARTKVKLTEERSHLSDSILTHVANLILVANAHGEIVYASPSIREVLGYEPSEALGDGWLRLSRSTEADRLREKSYLARSARGESSPREAPYERRVYDRDGKPHWILWQDARGPQNTLIGIGADVTPWRESQEQLRESEERYARAILGSKDGIWDWDLLGDRVFYSPRWKSMLGFGSSELSDSPKEWISRIHPEDASRFTVNLDRHLDGKAPHFEIEYRM